MGCLLVPGHDKENYSLQGMDMNAGHVYCLDCLDLSVAASCAAAAIWEGAATLWLGDWYLGHAYATAVAYAQPS